MDNHYDSAPAGTDTGSMRGFDPEFTDIVDYILRITYRIWEGKQVGLCRDYYSEDCPVYTLAGYTEGAEAVTQNTMRTLSAFPDRTLHADNIIWGGNDEDGIHSSHLITTNMTNLGPSEFGEATGVQAQIQVIAHCVCKENRIVEEWLVRDNLSLALQLGVDPLAYAREQARKPLDAKGTFARWLNDEHTRVSTSGRERQDYPAQDEHEARISTALHNIWNARMVGDCHLLYAENARLHASARDDYDGVDNIVRFYLEILGSLPDARISVDYTCSNAMLEGNYIAARWVIAGTHSGASLWGEPTHAPIVILGESHYRLVDGKVMEEWLVFDELAVLTQVARARLAQSENKEGDDR
ncbi:ester cyclase [Pseudohalioglobus sediminis]|uniref:Ester cyclase n=1 Tax=Pseudohalioglobus sediminis TaxID=2606449 RepID=A0A5B0WPY6_9GAMM|nr:ester cyclase [Pseudohalioglobus sediminis]KAA1189120.1 ester cyclase [Pseudohalioglobus sediminis]